MAAGAIALVGILPIYMALALSAIVFPTPPALIESWVLLGLRCRSWPVVGSGVSVRRLRRFCRYDRRLLPAKPAMLFAAADFGLVRLLYFGHAADDLYAMEPFRRRGRLEDSPPALTHCRSLSDSQGERQGR